MGLSLHARADPFHEQTLPLGQRAIGMGGAFTAVADDPSATFYNPAGLVLTNGSTLSASLTLNAFDRTTIKGGYRTVEGTSSLDHNTGTSLPVFVAAIKTLGRRAEDGRRRHAVALSSFTRDARRMNFDLETLGPLATPNHLETLTVTSSYRTAWYGLSYAYRVARKWSVGLSNFVSVTRTNYEEERIAAELGGLQDDGSFASSQSSWTTHRVQSTVKSFVWRFGVLHAVSPQLQLGVMFQPPSVHIRGSGNVRMRVLSTDLSGEAGVSRVVNVSESNLLARDPVPWELRLGGRYEFSNWLTLALDGSLYGSTGSASDPVIAIGPRTPNPTTGAIAQTGAFLAERWYRKVSGNVSLGASAILPHTITMRAGLYTDLSSAPSVPMYSPVYVPADVNRIGGTLSIGLRSEGYDVSIGAIGLFGIGNGVSFTSDENAGGATYARTTVTDRMFLVFLNGVKSAISTLAKQADAKLTEMREEQEELETEALPEPEEEEAKPKPKPKPKTELEPAP